MAEFGISSVIYQPIIAALLIWGIQKPPMYGIIMDKIKVGEEGGTVSPPPMSCRDNYPSQLSSAHGQGSSSGSYSSGGDERTGYDYEFVVKIDEKYECPICCYALRTPNQTKCGHRFCGACIKKWIREQSHPGSLFSCPICSAQLSKSDIFEDNFAKREILSLKIFCPNRSEGCSTVIELRNVDKHLSVCVFVLVECPSGCSSWMQRRDVEEHIKTSCERRRIKCKICEMEVTIENQESHLDSECPLVEVGCCHCLQKFKREELEAHKRSDCPKVIVDCYFKAFGCSTRMERDQLDTHLEINTQTHIKLIADIVEKLKQNQPVVSEIMASLLGKAGLARDVSGRRLSSPERPYRQPVNPLSTSPPSRNHSGSYPHENMNPQDLTSPYIQGHPHQKYTHPNLESLSLNMPTGYSDPLASTLRTPFSHPSDPPSDMPAHKLLRRQASLGLERNANHGMMGRQTASLDLGLLTNKQMDLERKVSEQQQQIVSMRSQLVAMEHQIAEQQLTIQRQEETIQSFDARNCGGKYVWKIDNYRQKKFEAQRGQRTVIHSPGFHTSLFGYKLCVRLNINGVESATGTHISLFVHFMQGEYDDILDWPFSGKIALAILDQTESSQCRQNITETLFSKPNLAAFQRPRSHRNHKGFGYVEFCPISVIEGSVPQYLKNDTLFIQVKVDMN